MRETGFRATALRYRPQTFAELIGQEHVSLTISNAIKNSRIAHSYLFSGPRGVGKTSAARILAKSLNCEQGPTASPCGVCTNCIEIAESRSLDVFEIDGASNRGIEQIRDLRESVRFTPARSRYKVYIIDEVHMLTNEAFNALLKTLEEPPPYIVFIFATTEPAKVKITIRSRCQHYRFKRIQTREIQARLRAVCTADGIPADDDALFLIARAADGSMRDSQSLFDQVASYSLDGITAEHVRGITGSIDSANYFDFLTFLLERDSGELLGRIAAMDDDGIDFAVFAGGLAEMLRNLVLLASGADAESLEMTPEDRNDLATFLDPTSVDGFSQDDAVILLNLLADIMGELHDARNPRRVFELALFRLVNFRNMVRPEEILRRIEELDRRLRGGPGGVSEIERRPGPGMPIEIAAISGDRPSAVYAREQAPLREAQPPARPQPTPVQPRQMPAAPQPMPAGQPVPGRPAPRPSPEGQPVQGQPAPQAAQPPRPPQAAQPSAGPGIPGVVPTAAAMPVRPVVAPVAVQQAAPAPAAVPPATPFGGDCTQLVRELGAAKNRENPFLAAVLAVVVRAEIADSVLLFWLKPTNRYHRSSIENSYSEEILEFFALKTNRNLRLECRFTDDAYAAPAPAPVAAPEAAMPVMEAPATTAPVARPVPAAAPAVAAPVAAPMAAAPAAVAPTAAAPAAPRPAGIRPPEDKLVTDIIQNFGGDLIADEGSDEPTSEGSADWAPPPYPDDDFSGEERDAGE